MKTKIQINKGYEYSDDILDNYVNTIVKHKLGGLLEERNFLLSKLYTDQSKDYLIAVTGSVDNIGEKIPINFYLNKINQQAAEGEKDDRRDVFDEILPEMQKHDESQAKILFPLNIIDHHWLLGEILIIKNGENCRIEFFAHDPYGGGNLREEAFTKIEEAIKTRLKEANLEVIECKNSKSLYKAQQSTTDNKSCGIIVADNLIKRIQGETLDINKPHRKGCSVLRNKQLKEMKECLGEEDKLYKSFKAQTCQVVEAKVSKTPKQGLDDKKEVFADPTYDATFKMLFGKEEHKNLTISLLNNLLGFTGKKEIKDLKFQNNELQTDSAEGLQGSVDVLCTTKEGKKIAIEMQKQHKDYFLSRTQEYMSKIVSNQMKVGQSEKYHLYLLPTYILVIAKQNIFIGVDKIEGKDKQYEKTVVPMIVELNQEVPGNKMHWKFYELQRFTNVHKKDKITADSLLKVQWLNFLAKCNEQAEEPTEANEIIKEGYKIMKMANWNEDQKTLYWLQKRTEALEEMEKVKTKRKLEEYEGMIQQKEAKIHEKDIKLKEKDINSIKSAQKFLELNVPKEAISSLTGFNLEQVNQISEYEGEIESLYELLNPPKELEHEAEIIDNNNSEEESDLLGSISEDN